MMCRRLMAAIVLLFTLAAGTAARAEITQEQLDRFQEEMGKPSMASTASIDLESVFYLAARIGKTPAGAVTLYADVRGIPEEQAQREAEFLIKIRELHEQCGSCVQEHFPQLLKQIREIGVADKSGFFFLHAANEFGMVGRWSAPESRKKEFFEMIKGHPGLKVICLGLLTYYNDDDLFVPLFAAEMPEIQAVGRWMTQAKHYAQARNLALLELAWRRIGTQAPGTADHAFLTAMLIHKLLVSAQTDEALRIYDAYPDKEQMWDMSVVPEFDTRKFTLAAAYEKLYQRLPGEQSNKYQVRYKSRDRWLRSSLSDSITHAKTAVAAALLLRGREQEAEVLLEGLSVAELYRLGLDGRQKVYFLREVMEPSLQPDVLYDVFMRNKPQFRIPGRGQTEKLIKNLPVIGDFYALLLQRTPGWLWIVDPPPFDELGAAYLEKAGYTTMARYLLSDILYRKPRRESAVFGIYADQLGPEFFARAAHYKERIEAAESERQEKVRALQKEMTPTPIHVSERPVLFEERKLPKGVKPFAPQEAKAEDSGGEGSKGGGEEESSVPKDLKLPVSPYQVVRLEKTGDEWTLIFLSQALDPVGEVSPGGYWVVRSRDGGRGWEAPVYLGLQVYFPYVVTPKSSLPLMNGNTLQIEVQVRELDTESITFPPIGLRAKRRQDGLYLRFDWNRLTQDSDADGLTDLAEHRMGLDPENADTDADGLFDGSDSLPLTAFSPRKTEENELAIAILRQILGYERQAIITGAASGPRPQSLEETLKSAMGPRPVIDPMHTTFMLADPGIFTGIQLRTRLLVYGPDAAERLEKQYGVFYPVSVQWVFSNKAATKHHVIWSASWTGGEFLLVKTAKGFKVISISRWVT